MHSTQNKKWLEYAQLILASVSFNPELFSKEYHKLARELPPTDWQYLHAWCRKQFGYDVEPKTKSHEYHHQN